MWGWMFSEKKLIIIHWVPKENDPTYKIPASTQQSVESWLTTNRDKIPGDHFVILVCHKPDKRTTWRKFFEKNAEIKKFEPLHEKAAIWFVLHALWKGFSENQASFIVWLIWTSKWNLVHEIEKIKSYMHFHWLTSISDEHIDQIVYHQGWSNAFELLDTLFSDKKKSLTLITTIQSQQQDIFLFTWMLYRWLKIMIQMVDCFNKWMSSSKEIASTIKAPPFSVAKQMKYKQIYQDNYQRIVAFYTWLLDIDYSIKTWRLPAEWYWPSIKKLLMSV